MRAVGRDLIRGGHYGQRSCEPHEKAGHMAAPTNAAKCEESPCQPGAVHTWQISFIDAKSVATDQPVGPLRARFACNNQSCAGTSRRDNDCPGRSSRRPMK